MMMVDGSQGEGGGQIVRTALALSMVTGRGIVLENIRAKRSKPGLLRQHLTAVEAAARISRANVQGQRLGSTRLVFEPGMVGGGAYAFQIGSAGSTTLVLQTILPALMIAEQPSTVTLEGGTHNPFAPPFEFLKLTFLPLLGRMGPDIDLQLIRHGFFPAGGGKLQAVVKPSRTLGELSLLEAGEVSSWRARALVANLPQHIGKRECQTIARKLDWQDDWCFVEAIRDSDGPGNVVMAEVERADVTEIFTGFGRRGVPAERVANDVVRQVRRYLQADVPVGEYLADQLLLPMCLGAYLGGGGGEFRTLQLSGHLSTQIDLLRTLLDVVVQVDERGHNDFHVRVARA